MDFKPAVEKAKNARKILIVSHYDCDGLCSAKILKDALGREGKSVDILIAKELTTEIVEEALGKNAELMIFSDLGSGYLSLMPKGKEIIILDHHESEDVEISENVLHINPCLGGKVLCGAGVCYLFAKELGEKNSDLIDFAVIGSIGDGQVEEGENKKIVREAQKLGRLTVEKGLNIFGHMSRPLSAAFKNSNHIPFSSESEIIQFFSSLNINLNNNGKIKSYCDLKDKEKELLKLELFKEVLRRDLPDPTKVFSNIYILSKMPKRLMDAQEFSTILNAFGRLEKFGEVFEFLDGKTSLLEPVMLEYRQKIATYLSWTSANLKNFPSGNNTVFIDAKDKIHENMIGTITSISINGLIKSPVVVGLAQGSDGIKISARSKSEKIDLDAVLSNICAELGGYGGGHAQAAGGKIPADKSEEFITRFLDASKCLGG
ncbi:MAG: DHHA1 domain-containing protein [Candidatus Aenigmatarchaeota archaeon]